MPSCDKGVQVSRAEGSDIFISFMASTHFEPSDARRAFPCWDEPALRATFDIRLRIPKHLVALSNMNVLSQDEVEDKPHLKEVVFATTPSMSTYLVAFAVGELDYIEGKTMSRGIIVRAYSLKGTAHLCQFAIEIACQALNLYEDWFGIPYPLPKLDLIAIPDFNIGAMENWGLVTFRTVRLHYDPATSSIATKQRVASIVAHELAHQWFGNLVALKWWSELWLKEGFATWVASYTLDYLFPEWGCWTQFIMDETAHALELDSLLSTHPIEVPVKDPNDVGQIFDAISYSKGAAVIRMLFHYLGEHKFFSGIRSYLNKHKYSNASTHDLWESLSLASDMDVASFMAHWTTSVGYPVLSVTECDGGLSVSQTRCLYSSRSNESSTLWWVPLFWLGASPYDETPILNTPSALFAKPSRGPAKLNAQAAGVYRVHYSQEMLSALVKHRSTYLDDTECVNIIVDVAALSISGVESTTRLLDLFLDFDGETRQLVLEELGARLNHLASVWFEEPLETCNLLKALRLRIFLPLLLHLGWDQRPNERPVENILRALAIANIALGGNEEVSREARIRFSQFVSGDQSAIHPELRSIIYQIAVREGEPSDYHLMKQLYMNTEPIDLKLAALCALGTTRDLDLIEDALTFSISENVRPQDSLTLIASVARNPLGRRSAWSFVKNHWAFLVDRNSGTVATLGNILKYTAGSLSSHQDAQDIADFFKGKSSVGISRALENTLERVNAHSAWLERDRSAVSDWLHSKLLSDMN
ncbi:hypothetical protein DSO57_1004996 [Entomophthora muscae]|uniref:Uncharacterized protein n=1 Tax=Entomophthora muscae TaxID=34485 RepID=A0ACC2SXT8_9FUNG|nr:hypothetical protein DSO57_1004996 [Entomophthora muscae]